MPKIELLTEINSTAAICFDLSRSIDLHTISTAKTKEKAVAGRTSGLIGLNETVTWQAVHFGIQQKLTTKITAYDKPNYFIDEQVSGAFKSFIHIHSFEQKNGIVYMKDEFEFTSPFGVLGILFNKMVLTNYMKNLLMERNLIIKTFAETDKWKAIIEVKNENSSLLMD